MFRPLSLSDILYGEGFCFCIWSYSLHVHIVMCSFSWVVTRTVINPSPSDEIELCDSVLMTFFTLARHMYEDLKTCHLFPTVDVEWFPSVRQDIMLCQGSLMGTWSHVLCFPGRLLGLNSPSCVASCFWLVQLDVELNPFRNICICHEIILAPWSYMVHYVMVHFTRLLGLLKII